MTQTNRMLVAKIIVAILLMALVCHAELNQNDFEPVSARRPRRSLCNPFGGCGAKRSIAPGQVRSQSVVQTNSVPGNFEPVGSLQRDLVGRRNGRDPSVELVSEALTDLLEYMKMNENYRQGKFVVVVPNKYPDIIPKSNSLLVDDSQVIAEQGVKSYPVGQVYMDKNE